MPVQSAGEALPGGRAGDRPSVAALPFANLSRDPEQDYFSDGVAEDVITELSRFSELLVIARNSSFQYKGKAVDIRQVGRQLGARYVLEGSVRRSGDRVPDAHANASRRRRSLPARTARHHHGA